MIRQGKSDDIKSIMHIIKNAIVDMEYKDIHQWDHVYPTEEIFLDDIKNKTLYVYEKEGIIQGIIVLNEHQEKEYEDLKWIYETGDNLVIHRLCIDPKYQGTGIAQNLMAFSLDYAKKNNYKSIRLDAFGKNERACSFYKKLGYIEIGTVIYRKGIFYCFEKGI